MDAAFVGKGSFLYAVFSRKSCQRPAMTTAIPAKSERTEFELTGAQWNELQAALDRPVRAKPKLEKLLSEPGLLG